MLLQKTIKKHISTTTKFPRPSEEPLHINLTNPWALVCILRFLIFFEVSCMKKFFISQFQLFVLSWPLTPREQTLARSLRKRHRGIFLCTLISLIYWYTAQKLCLQILSKRTPSYILIPQRKALIRNIVWLISLGLLQAKYSFLAGICAYKIYRMSHTDLPSVEELDMNDENCVIPLSFSLRFSYFEQQFFLCK